MKSKKIPIYHNIIITGTSKTPMACVLRTPKYGGMKPIHVDTARTNRPRIPVNTNTIAIMKIMIVITILRYGNFVKTFANFLPMYNVKKNAKIAATNPASSK